MKWHLEQNAFIDWCNKISEKSKQIIGQTPFYGVLFTLRKQCGQNQTLDDLKSLWKKSSDMISKVLFKTPTGTTGEDHGQS